MIEICDTLGTYQNSKSLTDSYIRVKKPSEKSITLVLIILIGWIK